MQQNIFIIKGDQRPVDNTYFVDKTIQVQEYFLKRAIKSVMRGLDLNSIRVSMCKHGVRDVLE